MPPSLVIAALAVLFLAALTKSVLGFADTLVAMPLLTLTVGLHVATPVAMVAAFSVSCLMMVRHWRKMDLGAAWRLLVAALFGIPLGVWGLKQLPEAWLTTFLGILLILVGLYYLRRPALPARSEPYWTYLFGFLAGVLGGAYNIAAPPLLIHGTLRRWSPEQFRSTLQGFFVVLDAMIMVGHFSAGLWTPDVLQLFALSIPVLALGFWVGNRIGDRLPTATYERLLYVALIVLGVMLML